MMAMAAAAESSTDNDNDDLVDITALVTECAASLTHENSILCSEETYDPHNAMAALELMDVKMDCCEIPTSAAKGLSATPENDEDMVPPRPLPTGLDDDVAPLLWKELTVQDASVIAVEALTRLESMLTGASVAESVYTCLYTHNAVLLDMKTRIESTDDEDSAVTPAQRAVYALSLALVAISKIVRDIVLRADIYEEEDFSTQMYGLEFFDEVLKVESYLDIENGVKSIAGVEGGRPAELVLRFLLDFLKSCVSMSEPSSDMVVAVAEATKINVKSGQEKLQELKNLLLEEANHQDTSQPALLRRCFDPFMYRPLVGNAPIRKITFCSPLESIPVLSNILSEIGWASCDLILCGSSLGQVRRMLNRLSKESINVLSRSLMILNLYFDDKFLGIHDLQYLMATNMKRLAGAPDALLGAKYGQALLTRMAKPVYDTLKLFLLNQNRQQAYLDAAMIPDWSSLQQEARAVDLNYCMEAQLPTNSPPFFSHYVLYTLVWLMDHYVALGLELKLYCGYHDLSVAYWYRDVLLSSLLNTRMAMHGNKVDARKKQAEEISKSKGRKKGAKGKKAVDVVSKEDTEDDFELSLLLLKRTLCRGLARVSQARLGSISSSITYTC